MAGRTVAAGLVLTVLLAVLTACTSSGGTDPTAPLSSSTQSSPTNQSTVQSTAARTSTSPTTPRTSTAPPEAAAAKSAYLKYTAATFEAERTPKNDHNPQLSTLAIDPALGTFEGLLTQLQIAGIANRGTPPISRVKITKLSLAAKPYPTVFLVDCPTVSPTWLAYDVKTGKPVKVVANPVKPPYAITVTVVQYKGKWVVHQTNANRNHTCTP